MAISESNVISEILSNTCFSVQTSAENGAGTNTTANILYNTASRKQGNFSRFLDAAEFKLAQDMVTYGKTPSDAQQETLLAYLIAAAQEKKETDFRATSVSMSGYSVSRPDQRTSYEVAYHDYLNSLSSADITATTTDDDEKEIYDSEHYPDSWRLSGLNRDAEATDTNYPDPL